jgi:chemotaxis protein methyltransferase CheR
MFHGALSDGGFLVMEQTQKLPQEAAHLFEPVVSNAQLFRKTAGNIGSGTDGFK